MPNLVSVRGSEPWRRRLLLPTYTVADAARYIGGSPQLVSSWFYRETKTGVTLPGKAHGEPLSYLQLIEVAVVSTFRKVGVTLENIRKSSQYLAQMFNTEHPLTEYRFKTEGLHVLVDLSNFERDEDLHLVATDKGGQLAWQEVIENRLLEFDYEDGGIVIKWHPAGRHSLVVIDPRISFGAPNVSGIPTWILKGRYTAGESIADIIEDFNLDETAIKDAWKFEGIDIASLTS